METTSLNPCCSGRWSRTRHSSGCNGCSSCVLILVVVDNGLVLGINGGWDTFTISLNPCCSGQWSRTEYLNSIAPKNGES